MTLIDKPPLTRRPCEARDPNAPIIRCELPYSHNGPHQISTMLGTHTWTTNK